MASRGVPAVHRQSTSHDGVSSSEDVASTYRRTAGSARAARDDQRYPALLTGLDKAVGGTGNTRNSFIGDDVEKLYDFTATAAVATDVAGRRGVACPTATTDYSPAVERASSTVDVGRTLALFGTDRLYQSACPLCVHPGGSTSWTREAVYVERRPVMSRRGGDHHDVDCPLHVAKSSLDVARRHEQQQPCEMSVYPPGLRSPDQLMMISDDCQQLDHSNATPPPPLSQ